MRELYHRVHHDEPLRATANRSLPGAHLSPSLAAVVIGLTDARADSAAVRATLRGARCSGTGLTLPKLASETGVSIARFERLVELAIEADAEADGPVGALQRPGTAFLLRHLWQRCAAGPGRPGLLEYLTELDAQFGPVLVETRADERSFEAEELRAPSVRAAATALYEGDDDGTAAAFELLACALARGGARAPPIAEHRVGYKGHPPRADCAELVTREILNGLLWDAESQAFDTARLGDAASEALKAFYAPGGMAYAGGGVASAEAFMAIASDLKGVKYLAGVPKEQYEMAPTFANVLAALQALLRTKLPSASALERLWREAHAAAAGAHAVLKLNAAGDRMTVYEPAEPSARAPTLTGWDEQLATTPAATRRYAELGLAPVLEVVLSEGRNHAFAAHFWGSPSWQRPVAALAYSRCRADDAAGAAAGGVAAGGVAAGGVAALRRLLLPALVQPLLQLPPAAFEEEVSAARAARERERSVHAERLAAAARSVGRSVETAGASAAAAEASAVEPEAEVARQRLLLLATDVRQPAALAASIERLLAAALRCGDGDGGGGGAACARELQLAVPLLEAAPPLHAALAPPELAALARCVADAAAAAGDEHAAPLDAAQPVLAAAAALHRGRSGIGQWWQALRAAPLQVVSTTARMTPYVF